MTQQKEKAEKQILTAINRYQKSTGKVIGSIEVKKTPIKAGFVRSQDSDMDVSLVDE